MLNELGTNSMQHWAPSALSVIYFPVIDVRSFRRIQGKKKKNDAEILFCLAPRLTPQTQQLLSSL